jgi:hypothetical protein
MDSRPLPLLSDYLELPLQYWRRLVAGALLGALVGLLAFYSLPTRYVATSRVALAPQVTFVSLNEVKERQPLVTVDTTATLLTGDEATSRIALAMALSDDEARESLNLSAKPLSRALVVQVRADTRRQAVAGVNAATDALAAIQADEFSLNRGRVRSLKNRVAVLRAEAQERIADGNPAQELFEVVEIMQLRLDNAVATNNSDSTVIQRARVVPYRAGQGEVFLASGMTVGFVLALLWTRLTARAGQPRRSGTTRKAARR